MASYRDPALRDRLAAEYALGTLRGPARARFEALMRYDPDLRERVGRWSERFAPLAEFAPDIAPPARLWPRIARRIGAARPPAGGWSSLAWWRALAAAGMAGMLVLALTFAFAPRSQPPMAMIAVLNDEAGQPALVVSWPPMKEMRDPHVRIQVVQAHPVMNPGTAWEMWMMPGGDAKPVSMGLIGIDRDQTLRLSPAVARRMDEAWALAMSVEPEGGSPTGAPSGPVIFHGRCVKLKNES